MNKKIIAGIFLSIPVILIFAFLAFAVYVKIKAPGTFYNTKDSVNKFPATPYVNVNSANGDGEKIVMMYIDNPNSEEVVLHLHGNAGRTIKIIDEIAAQYDVISPAYPGYFESEGAPSERKIYETVDVTIDYLTNDLGYDMNEIIVYGHSMGGSPALYAAKTYGDKIKATILVNTFDKVQSLCADTYKIACFLLSDFHNNVALAKEAKGKVRQYHSPQDEKISYDKAVRLSKAFTASDYKFSDIGGTHSVFDALQPLEEL